MSCGMIAMRNAGIEVESYDAYEIDEYAIKVSQHNFPEIKHHGDVFKGDFTRYKGLDWIIGGSPCFVAGTMIITKNGVKPIEDIVVGDEVLTHKGRYKTVKETMNRISPTTVVVKAENCGEIECTKEHPFYTKDVVRVFNQKKRAYDRVLDNNFCWTDPKHFRKTTNTSGTIKQQTYLTSVSDTIEKFVEYNGVDLKTNKFSTKHMNTLQFNDENLWYLIGRWLGDGWFCYKYRNKKKLSGIKICCGKSKVAEFESKLNMTGFNYCKSEERTVCKYTISNLELALYIQKFGIGASNKRLAKDAYFLPKKLGMALLNGYFDSDGYINGNVGAYSTVSKELAYGIKYLINKHLKTSCTIVKHANHSQIIEGRKVNTKDVYSASFTLERQKQSHYFVEDNYIIAPFKSVTYLNEPKTVYNLSVEEDESYTANGMAVHNCTYWSIAQKNNRETEASGLGWELFQQYVRAIKEAEPKYFLYENNKSMSKEIRASIDEAFGFEAVLINSALVSAQNRQRLYWVGKRNEDGTYSKVNVEQPEDRGILLKDVLDNAVAWQDKSYCMTASYNGAVIWNSPERGQRTMVAEPVNITPDGKSQTLKAQYQKNNISNFCCYSSTYGASGVAEPVCVAQRGRYSDTGKRCVKGEGVIEQFYEARADGKTNAITTVQKDNAICEPVCMRYERSEEAKSVRKQYEAGEIHHGFNELNELHPRTDGKTNTLSTVLKDNQICEPIRIGCMPSPECIESADKHKKAQTIYEVKDGQITIKGKRYPIKLADGYYIIRKLTVTECMRLQTIPDWYDFSVISNSQAYKCLGNGWTCDVITHLIKSALNQKTSQA